MFFIYLVIRFLSYEPASFIPWPDLSIDKKRKIQFFKIGKRVNCINKNLCLYQWGKDNKYTQHRQRWRSDWNRERERESKEFYVAGHMSPFFLHCRVAWIFNDHQMKILVLNMFSVQRPPPPSFLLIYPFFFFHARTSTIKGHSWSTLLKKRMPFLGQSNSNYTGDSV